MCIPVKKGTCTVTLGMTCPETLKTLFFFKKGLTNESGGVQISAEKEKGLINSKFYLVINY